LRPPSGGGSMVDTLEIREATLESILLPGPDLNSPSA